MAMGSGNLQAQTSPPYGHGSGNLKQGEHSAREDNMKDGRIHVHA